MTGTPACRGARTDIFYDSRSWAEAAEHCRRCPLAVKLQCRQDFADDPWAYAGGMTPGQRAAWARNERARLPKSDRPPPVTRPRRSKLTEDEVRDILKIFDTECVGTKSIADRVGLAKSTVQRVLRQNDRTRTAEEQLELSRAGGASGGNKALGEKNAKMVMDLFSKGYSANEVVELSGLSLSHIYLVRRKKVMELLGQNYGADVVGKMCGLTEDHVLKIYRRFK